MGRQLSTLPLFALLVTTVFADIYIHNPRGSNNRLNERSANRRNANRLFDSQNNNRGGHNVGDLTDQAAGNDEGKQNRMKYFMGGSQGADSLLTFEWTNQHGCGGNEDDNPQKQNCRLVLQFACQPDVDTPTEEPKKEQGTRIYTNRRYHYKPISDHGLSIQNKTSIRFGVRACNDAHIALTETKGAYTPNKMFEIVIGGWRNSKTVLRSRKQGPNLLRRSVRGRWLNCGEMRFFKLSWTNGVLTLFSESANKKIFAYDKINFNISFMSLATGWGSDGNWLFGTNGVDPAQKKTKGTQDTFRNGVNTNTQDYTRPPGNANQRTEANRNQRKNNNVKQDRGLHESWDMYEECYYRERNQGLFTADQNLRRNNGLGYSAAIYTRQNPNGNRRGYECPEEKDYYPYWHPTMWKDIAILAENQTLCSDLVADSFNTQNYHACVETYPNSNTRKYSRYNNEADCTANGGTWTEFSNYLEKADFDAATCASKSTAQVTYFMGIPWDSTTFQPECLVKLPAPECQEAPWSRSNHHGNGIGGEPNSVTWKIPYFPSGDTQRCVLRMRYNISTDDYDPFNTDSSFNGENSPVQNNPYVNIGLGRSPLRLALNTAQTGRVFQDRTHVFLLRQRPSDIDTQTIYNLNVRGKRGNIVQTYPAVEYDFVPTNLNMGEDELVHIQWEGSNTHNNGRPAGDGQSGDAGEGQGGTDRHNLLEMPNRKQNFPYPFEKTTMWNNAEIKWIYHGKTDVDPINLALNMASSGYYRCIGGDGHQQCPEFPDHLVSTKEKMQNQLNNAPASYEGAVLKFKKGTYHYMCTRNNNFTNRSQKGSIIVQ